MVIGGTFKPEMPSLVDLGGDPNIVFSESSSSEERDTFIRYSVDPVPSPSRAATSEIRELPLPIDSRKSVE